MGMQGTGQAGSAMLEQMRAYWTALCAGGMPPTRAEIDPRGIAGALEHSLVAERNAAGAVVIRIAGMGLGAMAGVDLSGMPVLSLFDTAARDGVAGALDRMLDEPAVVEMWLEALRGPGRPALEARLLLLPLRAADGRVCMVLGCVAAAGEVGQPPRRFAVASRAVTPIAQTAPGHSLPTPAFAEPATAFVGQVPHLRVVRAAG